MYLPNYKNGSLVNLMSSITTSLGDDPLYEPLSALTPDELSASRNIVLLVVDGLGYEYLVKHGQDSILHEHLRDKMTSVFPSTTAACVTTFVTGVAPQQHAVTGWFVHLKELGAVSAILPFKPRNGGPPFSQAKVEPKEIFDQEPFSTKIKAQAYTIMPKVLVKSDYNQATAGNTKLIAYRNLRGFFKTIRKVVRSNSQRKYVYAYWPQFDALSHQHGNNSQQVTAQFAELNKRLTSFFKSLRHTDTTFIITADHGFIDTGPSKTIELKDHPQLMETLALPLCGEARTAYCYVRPARTAQFEAYVTEHFSEQCRMCKSEELIANNYFGLFDPNPKLFERVGDYVLLMKDNYVLKDSILGESKHVHIGYHGGVSKEEMFVPLVVIKK